jgi:hypothetical protein
MSTPVTGTIIRDLLHASPVNAFYDPVANEIRNVSPPDPLPTIQNLLALCKTSELPRPTGVTLAAGDLLGTSIAITGTDAVDAVAQVSTLTPSNVNINDVFTAIINGLPISYTALAATVADVVAGLAAAITASAQGAIVTAVNTSSQYVTVTARVAGTAFTITTTTTTGAGVGNQTLITSTTTPNFAGTAQVYTATPANIQIGDTFRVTINGTNVDFIATGTDVPSTIAGMISAINANGTVNSVVLATNGTTNVIITAKAPGTSFTCTGSAIAGTTSTNQKTTIATPTANRTETTAVAQVFHLTPANVQIGDTFRATINSIDVDYVAQAATVADVIGGLIAAINLAATVKDAVIASDGTTYIIVTSKTAGTAFTCVGSTIPGTTANNQKVTVATTTENHVETLAIAQVEKLTPAVVEIGDKFTATINGFACFYIATEATVADVCNGLAATINLDENVKDVITAVDHGTYITVTADVAGTSFTCVPSVLDGGGNDTQTLTKTTLQVNVPYDAPIAQVSTATPANVEIDDTFRVTLNSHNVDFVATAATVANVVAGLVSAINNDVTVKDVVLAENITSTYVKITAKSAGTAFTIAGSTIAGTGANNQSLTALETQINVVLIPAIAQISTATPDNIEIDDIFTVVINSVSIPFTATAATQANVVAGLIAAINGSAQSGNVLATYGTDHVIITSKAAGTSFTITGSATPGTGANNQKVTATQTVANAAKVPQVSRVTPTNVEINDTFYVTINGTTVNFVATVATVANVTAGLQTLIDALPLVSATDQGTYVEITADTAGVAFTISSTTLNGTSPDTQALAVATNPANVVAYLGHIILAASAAHGLTVGQLYPCTIASVLGNTNANGSRMIKPTDTTHFQIYDTDGVTPILSNAQWISGGTIACIHYFKDIINITGGKGVLKTWIITIENNALITTGFTLFLYKSQPTTVADDAPKTILYANEAILLGYVTGIPRQFFPSGSDALQIVGTSEIEVESDTTDLYGELVTDSGITIQASKRVSIKLVVEQKQSI